MQAEEFLKAFPGQLNPAHLFKVWPEKGASWSALCSREESLEQHRAGVSPGCGIHAGIEDAEWGEAGMASAGLGSICTSSFGKGD